MKDILFEMLTGIIIAIIPLLTTYFVAWVRNKTANLKSDLAEKYINEVAIAVADAVTATSQTYVDDLRKSGTFTLEAQKQAAQKALDACIASLSPKCIEFLNKAYDDVEQFIANKIEAEVRNQKIK